MPSSYTNNLGIELPGDGELDGVWGDVVNDNMSILDRAVNGSLSLSLTGTASTLTTTDGVLSNGQYKLLQLTGTPSGTHTITISPNDAQKIYFVYNTTAQSVVFTQGSGGNVTIATGDSGIIYSNGGGAAAAVTNLTDHFAMSSVKITGGNITGVATLAATTGNFGLGAVGTPSITFTGDTNTGIFSPGADTLAFVEGGVEAMRISSAGFVGIGTSTPGSLLDVNGTIGAAQLIFPGGNSHLQVRAGNVISFLDIDFPQVTTEVGTVRLYRNTNTTGVKSMRFHRGDGTATEDVRIAVGTADSFFGLGGGDLGVGTGTPAVKLDVLSDGLIIRAQSTTSTEAYMRFDGTGTSFPFIGLVGGIGTFGNTDASPIRFNTNTLERMRIDSAGDVGIGTIDPLNKLHIVSTPPAAVPAAGANGHLLGIGTNPYGLAAGVITDGSGYFQATRWDGTATNYNLLLQPNGGNVGIGTTNPLAVLQVNRASGAADIRLSVADVSYGNLFSSVSGTSLNSINAAPLVFGTTNTERMRIFPTGGVSIGNTADPGAKNLSVTGDLFLPALTTETRSIEVGNQRTGNGASLIDLVGDATYTDYGARLVREASGPNAETALYHRGTGLLRLYTQEAAPIVLTTNNAERMRITSTGFVGVGTNNPLQPLHILTSGATIAAAYVQNDTGDAGYFLRSQNTGLNTIYFGDIADFQAGYIQYSHSIDTLLSRSAGPVVFQTGGSNERMRITSAGDLGVGTAAPTNFGVGYQTIQVNATNGGVFRSSNTAGTAVGDFYADTTGVVILRSATNVPLTLQTNSVERFRIGTAGQLGIGGATYGTAGQVLTSGGPSAAPSWATAAVGSVTSVAVSGGTTGLTTSGGPITTTGTITLAGTLAVANGGTGATTDSGARSNLGLVIGTNVQAYDAGLQSIAGLTTVADRMIYTTASDVYAVATLTAAGRAILDDADAATQRTTLGLAIGSNVQAWDTNLDQIAALAPTADNFIVGNGSSWTLETPAQALASLGVTVTAADVNAVTAKVPRTTTTGSAVLPSGTTGERDGTPAAGYFRFNSTLASFEGYNGSVWGSVGGATGGGSDRVFYENGQTVTTNYTITDGRNAMSAGPITINSGITVTVGTGEVWTVV